jgi:HK97 family phage major capsid protein
LDERRGEDDLLSAEDAATYEKMETEVVNLGKEIERLERQAALDLELSQATSQALKTVPGVGEKKQGRATDEYTRAFWKHMRNRGDFEVRNALTIGTDSEGGYLVPDEFERTLIEALEEENIMRQLAKVITTSSGDKKIPVVASKGTAAWVDEEGAIPEDDDAFGQVSIGAYKVATMIKVSEELLNDSIFNLESYIAREFARRIGAKEEEAFLVGDGSGKPAGIFDDTHGGEIGVTTSTANIKMDEIFDLFYSLKSPYRKRATFITNDATVKEIRKLKDGQGQYLWQPSVKAGEPDTLLNRPVRTSAYVPTIEPGAKVIAFGDFGYYWIADRQGRAFQRLSELYAATGQVGFRATQRVDGKLILKEAVKILKMKA